MPTRPAAPAPDRTTPYSRCALMLGTALALASLAAPAHADGELRSLPPEVRQALQRVQIPVNALAAVVIDTATGERILDEQGTLPMNPASLMKLLPTMAALDRLGPAFTWRTPVWLDGPVRDGVLHGNLHVQGRGDPRLTQERLWLLLRRVQQLGVREIRGDIVVDSSAFELPEGDPAAFDGEPLRPYNVKPSALLLNFRSVIYSFVPDPGSGTARVLVEPPMAGLQADRSVPLGSGPCGDWRAGLKASFEPLRTRFAGNYPAACGELNWAVADPEPTTYDARLLAGLWQEMGGRISGRVRPGPAPQGLAPSFEQASPPLLDTVRDINKFSNNVMAQQLFLTLALQAQGGLPVTEEAAQQALRDWLQQRLGDEALDVVVHNGSGLSRRNRISARTLAHLLMQAYDSPVMSELMSSLPISGVDGTLRRSRAQGGRAHLKTGTLRDVSGLAGYVLSNSGRRYVLVAIVNHAQGPAARPALEALVQWTLRDAPLR